MRQIKQIDKREKKQGVKKKQTINQDKTIYKSGKQAHLEQK